VGHFSSKILHNKTVVQLLMKIQHDNWANKIVSMLLHTKASASVLCWYIFSSKHGFTVLFAADVCVLASCTIISTQKSLQKIVHRSKKHTLKQNKTAALLFIYLWSNKHTIKCSHKFWNHNLQKQCHHLHQGNLQSLDESPFCAPEMRWMH